MNAEDQSEIRNLIARVAWLTDQWESHEQFVANYVEDCSWQIQGQPLYEGRAGLSRRLDETLHGKLCGPGLPTRHCVMSTEVIPDGGNDNLAMVKSYVIMMSMKDGIPIPVAYGEYYDKVRCEQGRWLMVSRLIVPFW